MNKSCSSEEGSGSCSKREDEKLHVLAVDDNIIDRKLIQRLLNTSSFKVTTVENAMSALEYLGIGEDQQNTSKVCKVNLVLTDYFMPEMTGYDLLKKIKESSRLKEVPVVMMSSENIPWRINKCLEEGAEMFMLKPLTLSDVEKLKNQLMKCRH
ncbi:unnamed protein product [Amaranthus hypochondriacus]